MSALLFQGDEVHLVSKHIQKTLGDWILVDLTSANSPTHSTDNVIWKENPVVRKNPMGGSPDYP